jgi:DNA-binding MarR family transcriptional regulator
MATLKHPRLVSLIMAALDSLLNVEKTQILEVGEVRLHPSEIHLLLFLKAEPQANVTEIARRFSVTKGAVSQTLTRLSAKGIITKSRSSEGSGDLSISFTKLGESLMPRVHSLKDAAERRFDAHLEALGQEEREAVGRFFQRILQHGGPPAG